MIIVVLIYTPTPDLTKIYALNDLPYHINFRRHLIHTSLLLLSLFILWHLIMTEITISIHDPY